MGYRLAATARDECRGACEWLALVVNREAWRLVRGLTNTGPVSKSPSRIGSGAGLAAGPALFPSSLEAKCNGLPGSDGVRNVWTNGGDDG